MRFPRLRYPEPKSDFVHNPLEDKPGAFRLLRLLPNDNEYAEIECELFHASLNDEPEPVFEALSYVWGRPIDRKTPSAILVEGQKFFITDSLTEALLNLRRAGLGQVIWVDAVCINQTDDKEKSTQVQQMRHIYSSASRVLVWLGTERALRGPVGTYIALFDRIAELQGEVDHVEGAAKDAALHHAFERFLIVPPSAEELKMVGRFLFMPWFTRVWTIQELVVCKKALFIVGSEWIDWNVLEKAITFLASLKNYMYKPNNYNNDKSFQVTKQLVLSAPKVEELKSNLPPVKNALIWLRARVVDRSSIDLISLIVNTSYREASDQRDKVFALIGLATEAGAGSLQADYTKTTPEVYQEAMMSMIQHDPHMDALIFSGISAKRVLPQLPSWTADLSLSLVGRLYGDVWTPERSLLGHWGAGGLAPKPPERRDSRAIMLKGVLVDQVRLTIKNFEKIYTLSNLLHRTTKPFDSFQRTRAALVSQGRITASCITRPKMAEAPVIDLHRKFWDTLSFGLRDLAYSYGYSEEDGAESNADRSYRSRSGNGDTYQALSGLIDPLVCGQEMIVSQHDYFGVAPKMTRENDFVCVFLGARVPFIIRRLKKSDRYIIVGPCYVTGLMNGEIIEEVGHGKRHIEDLIIE